MARHASSGGILWADRGRHPALRERADQLRQSTGAATRASWTAILLRSMLFALFASLFLSLVGAFGTMAIPFIPRTTVFLIVGIGCGFAITVCVRISYFIPVLRDRWLLRSAATGLMVTPLVILWNWLVIGFAVLHRPRLDLLPVTILYVLPASAAFSVLSALIFRPRDAAAAADPATIQPRLLERLPLRLRGAEVYAVEAEDHYLRLHTSKGSDLILMRLSDAIAELEGLEGAQTHRSWWVAKSALTDARRWDGRATLKLKNGAEAPVSRTYARALRKAGWF
jgi:hypothetical protein